MLQRPLGATLFPYTTLFRSPLRFRDDPDAPRSMRDDLMRAAGAPIQYDADRGLARLLATIGPGGPARSEEHTSELQSHVNLVCRLLLEKKNKIILRYHKTTH